MPDLEITAVEETVVEEVPEVQIVGSPAFMERMRRQFSAALEEEKDIRAEALKDQKFRAGDQWKPAAKQQREAGDRPAEVFNKIPLFIAQVVNESRKNKVDIKFVPVDDQGDPDTAKVCEELARAIQYSSDADVAYEFGLDAAVGSSFGFLRMITRYCDDETDQQEIAFIPVIDPMSVYGVLVPSAYRRKVPFAFVCEMVGKDEFERDHPTSKLTSDWGLAELKGVDLSAWIEKDQVRRAEYWWVEWEARQAPTADGKFRTVQIPHVWSCKTNGIEVLDDSVTEWPGKTIPIWAVLGAQLVVDGKLHLFSVTRWIRAPQVMINFAKNRIIEVLATQPVSPFIGPAGFMRGREEEWKNLNRKLTPALEYEFSDVAGHPLPPPSRQIYEPPIGALSNFVAQEEEDLKSGTGIYDARLGASSNETSGVAIQRRTAQGETANYHFLDNLARTQKQAGTELAVVMPKVYDTPRWVRIIGEDETERMARINEPYLDRETGEQKNYPLRDLKFDIRVVTGPAFSSKRQETAELLGRAVQAAPQLMNVIGDLYFRNLDAAGGDQMADRMKRWIASQSPGLIDQEKQGAAEVPPEVQQKLQQAGQMVEQLTKALNQLQQEKEAKQAELESRERVEAAKIEAQLELKRMDIAIQAAKLESQHVIEQFRMDLDLLKSKMGLQHEDESAMEDRAHQAEQSGIDRAQQYGQEQLRLQQKPESEPSTEAGTQGESQW